MGRSMQATTSALSPTALTGGETRHLSPSPRVATAAEARRPSYRDPPRAASLRRSGFGRAFMYLIARLKPDVVHGSRRQGRWRSLRHEGAVKAFSSAFYHAAWRFRCTIRSTRGEAPFTAAWSVR